MLRWRAGSRRRRNDRVWKTTSGMCGLKDRPGLQPSHPLAPETQADGLGWYGVAPSVLGFESCSGAEARFTQFYSRRLAWRCPRADAAELCRPVGPTANVKSPARKGWESIHDSLINGRTKTLSAAFQASICTLSKSFSMTSLQTSAKALRLRSGSKGGAVLPSAFDAAPPLTAGAGL